MKQPIIGVTAGLREWGCPKRNGCILALGDEPLKDGESMMIMMTNDNKGS